MHYTPYRPNSHSWIGGLVAFIIGIIATVYIVSSISTATAQVNPSLSNDVRIEMLEKSVKELQEKNADLEDRLNYMGDSLGTTIELVDRLEAKVGL